MHDSDSYSAARSDGKMRRYYLDFEEASRFDTPQRAMDELTRAVEAQTPVVLTGHHESVPLRLELLLFEASLRWPGDSGVRFSGVVRAAGRPDHLDPPTFGARIQFVCRTGERVEYTEWGDVVGVDV